jgi:hypothetical protein
MKKKYFIYFVILILIFLTIWFTIDIRVNSTIFINRTLNEAFNKRIAGDIKGFRYHLVDTTKLRDIKKTTSSVLQEDTFDLRLNLLVEKKAQILITKIEVKEISYDIGKDYAFALIKIFRTSSKYSMEGGNDFTKLVQYKLRRINGEWKIENNSSETLNSILNN